MGIQLGNTTIEKMYLGSTLLPSVYLGTTRVAFETLGPEVIVNGDFSAGSTGWTIEATWTIGSGVASGNGANGSAEELTQAVLTSGVDFEVKFDILNRIGGSFIIPGDLASANYSANGSYTITVNRGSNVFAFRGNNFDGDIDNVSAREIL